MNNKKKIILLVVAFLLTIAASVGVTLAWLTAKTDEVTNTFAPSDIEITLTETKGTAISNGREFLMVPGHRIEKDPTVTVEANSEKCYVFVEVTKTDNLDTYLTYYIASGWTELTEGSGVYYRTVDKTATDKSFSILTDDKVTVKDTVTKADMDTLDEVSKYPKLTFKAYAMQYWKTATTAFAVEDAWQQARTSQSN
ncbi:MAG: hypothetical protein IJB76_04415 [Clostridia bacterium]|nr:hypothetical protein [Clostridia bacterium]